MEINPQVFAQAIGDAYRAGQEAHESYEQGYKQGQISEVTRIAAALQRQDVWTTQDVLKLIGIDK